MPRFASERGDFTMDGRHPTIHAKMVRPHPHVVGDAMATRPPKYFAIGSIKAGRRKLETSEAVKQTSIARRLDEGPCFSWKPINVPKAAGGGFDWERIEDISRKCIGERRTAGRHQGHADSNGSGHTECGKSGTCFLPVTTYRAHLG